MNVIKLRDWIVLGSAMFFYISAVFSLLVLGVLWWPSFLVGVLLAFAGVSFLLDNVSKSGGGHGGK